MGNKSSKNKTKTGSNNDVHSKNDNEIIPDDMMNAETKSKMKQNKQANDATDCIIQTLITSDNINDVTNDTNIYNERLNLLSTGYIRNDIANNIIVPMDIMNEIALKLKQSLEIKYMKYYSTSCTLPLQIYLENDDLNVIKPLHLKQYQIRYVSRKTDYQSFIDDGKMNIDKYVQQNEIRIGDVIVLNDNIYSYKCISYTSTDDICPREQICYVQILAIDCNDNIIAVSQWKQMVANVNSVSWQNPSFDYEAIRNYWKQNIAINSILGKVNVTQWVYAMNRLNVFGIINRSYTLKHDNDAYQQIFYFILALNGYGTNVDTINAKDFIYLICDESWEEYNGDFEPFIGYFREFIPNISKEDDLYN